MPKSSVRTIRRIIYLLIALAVVFFIGSRILSSKPGLQYVTAKVELGNVDQTVVLTGVVEPKMRYQLQFSRAGKIAQVNVRAGNVVKTSDILARLENGDINYQLQAVEAALLFAKTNLVKATAGSHQQEKNISQLKIDAAQLDLDKAASAMQNFDQVSMVNLSSANRVVEDAYIVREKARFEYGNSKNPESTWPALEKATILYTQSREIYEKAVLDSSHQKNILNDALQKAQVALKIAKEQYDLAAAYPRKADIAPLHAQMDIAWQNVYLARYQLDQTFLRAPMDGIVANVNLREGENANPAQPFIVFDSKNLQIKALVSEADIIKIKPGQSAIITFDAFGTDKEFNAFVSEIKPAETIVQGVTYYEVRLGFDASNSDIKSGMTANITIKTNFKENVLKIPVRALQYDGNQSYVQVLRREVKQSGSAQPEKRKVEVGLYGNENVEVVFGLQQNEEVVTFSKVN